MGPTALHGHLDALLLAILDGQKLHGYGIIEALRTRSGGLLEAPSGTVYPALRKLERAGYVASERATVDGRIRRTYTLTKAGSEALAGQRRDWREFAAVVEGILGGGAWPARA